MERETTLTCGNLSMDYQRIKTGQPVNFGQGWSTLVKLTILHYIWQVVPL